MERQYETKERRDKWECTEVEAEEKRQLRDIADKWERTEDEATQNNTLKALADYTKLFLSRLKKPGTESSKWEHWPSARSNHDSEVKCTSDNAIPHRFNPSIHFKNNENEETGQTGRLESIMQLGHDPIRLEELIRMFDQDVVRSGVDRSHPTFFGLIPGSGHLLYSFAEYLASIAHVVPLNRDLNAGACDMEASVLRWASDIIGYPEQARGCTVSGTSMGVIVAFSTARHIKLENSSQFNRSVVYLTNDAHPCHTRALRIVGLTDVVQRRVPTRNHRMDVGKLQEMITEDQEAGLRPFMVVGTAGTMSLGAIDPLGAIGEVALTNGLWFHVDAAVGGFLILDDSVKKTCEGINMADSVAMDFHKALSAPYGTAAVLVRDGSHLQSSMARESATYMSDAAEGGKYSPVDFTFEFTRPCRTFPVWFMLKILGVDMIKAALEEKVRLTKYALKSIRAITNVVTCMEPDLTVIAFRYVPPDAKNENDVTRKWHELIAEEGQVCLTPTEEDGLFYIRLCILSFRSHIEHVDTALASIKRNLHAIIKQDICD
ncbi:tryptophan decarboxylase-like [Liolophura sinensis]|uniref:tryptophan decarboxylase-like n=1 Tax=Liolophura sinensis TaxID=3198878 RepID=UPI003158D774